MGGVYARNLQIMDSSFTSMRNPDHRSYSIVRLLAFQVSLQRNLLIHLASHSESTSTDLSVAFSPKVISAALGGLEAVLYCG